MAQRFDEYGNPIIENQINFEDPSVVTARPGLDTSIMSSFQPEEDPQEIVKRYLQQKFQEEKPIEKAAVEHEEKPANERDLIDNWMRKKDLENSLNRASDLIRTTAGGIMTGSAPHISSASSSGSPLGDSIKLANLEQRQAFHGDRQKQLELANEMANKRLENSDVRMTENKEQFETRRKDALNKQFADFAKNTSGMGASSRNTVGRAALTMQAANAVKALAGDSEHWNNLTSQQIYELARAYDRTVSGGNPSITGTAHLVPNSALGNAQAFKQWLSNSPQGLKQSEFVKQMVAGAEREYQVSKKMRDDTLDAYAPGYQHLEELDPDRYNKILSGGKAIFSEDSGEDVKRASDKAEKNVDKMMPKKSEKQSAHQDGERRNVGGHIYERRNGRWELME